MIVNTLFKGNCIKVKIDVNDLYRYRRDIRNTLKSKNGIILIVYFINKAFSFY